jgi:demethylmenaquinone methyltransferase / 2-methoxy-6-polyprenyl-1,4-benzoquinol methylase
MGKTEIKKLPTGDHRKKYVKEMFNNIANRYDLLNHLLSFGVDYHWRNKTISKLDTAKNGIILDLASGTGDLAIKAIHKKSCKVIGIDLAVNMLKIGEKKRLKNKIENDLLFINGDGEKLPFKNDTFNGAMIAFGIRNMGNMQNAMAEVYRVLLPGSPFVILEFSLPVFPLFRGLYLFYFKNILPRLGKYISRDADAYTYLPMSVKDFPEITEFVKNFSAAGFEEIQYWKLLNGVAVIYRGKKINRDH